MKRFLKLVFTVFMGAAIAVFVARLAFPLPDISQRVASMALPASAATPLGRLMADGGVNHPDKSGVIPLRGGHDALASRLAVIAAAEQSIDAQYYIWHDDVSGILLLGALQDAAQRGVRVRLLLDDNGVPGLDDFMAALNAQDNFEIRLFNPSTVRSPRLAGYAFYFFRMNRRMHNKSLIADGAVAIVGGRNIGDEYFQVGDDVFYVDMDVLAIGAVVPETAAVFDDYWNSASVFEIESIIDGIGNLAAFETRAAQVAASAEATEFLSELGNNADRYTRGAADIEWTDVQLVADDPVKGQGVANTDQLMIMRLGAILGDTTERLDLVSAYFVPGRVGTAYFNNLARSGVEVRILTNALNTTDVLTVHAGYTKYRRELLEAGVDLFELKLRGNMTAAQDGPGLPLGLSGASLHAKTFAIDDDRIFIGSFNFDPRSASLNCEMGFLIDSPTLASRVSAGFDGPLAEVSYRPDITPEAKMIWRETMGDDSVVTYQEEPGATWLQQIAIVVIGFLPVEWLI
ncbi:putative cardiolipin synthase [Loktanella ponticola]|uniref:Phospholipase D n=1 Tax=Yoonia ponticola TaxID=1524255 RepID=A0A7W9EYV2_9RHOB|nr:phospholipase D family protein [Yoonia ponticola]MBB5723218.1 putative cardiolipin synthase [Yoonia ponticola]